MRRTSSWKHLFLGASYLLAAITLSGCDSCTKKDQNANPQGGSAQTTEENVIHIGEVASMTGSEASFGQSTHKGIEFAINEINASGGINGKKLTLTTMDDQGKPDEAANAITKLITQNKVVAVIGEVASSRSLAMAPIAQNHKVPMISPSSTNPRVTQQGDYIFRVCFIDPFQGAVMAKFAVDVLKVKQAAILRDVKSDYSMGLADYFQKVFTAKGGKIISDVSYSSGDIDFKSQLTKIRADITDTAKDQKAVIFIPGYYTEVGLIARQARELGIEEVLLGGDGWDSSKLKEIGGNAIDGSYFSNHYSPENTAPNIVKFTSKFKEIYQEVPDGLAAMGYDSIMVLADALKRSKSSSSSDIRDAIAQTKDLQGVTDRITIDHDRNAVKSAVILRVEKGEFKYHSTVSPQSIKL